MGEVIVTEVKAINAEALDEALRAALGARTTGLSYAGGSVTVHLSDKAAVGDDLLARQVVAAHDPRVLSSRQVSDAVTEAKLAAVRGSARAVIDPSTYADAQMQELAAHVVALELEVWAIRNGK